MKQKIRQLKKRFRRGVQVTPVDVLTGYAHWAEDYPPIAHNPLMQLEEQAMLSLLPDNLKGQTCLDLACGSGRYLNHLQTRQPKTIYGFDFSPHMLQQVTSPKHKCSCWAHPLTQAPFFPLPLPNTSLDLITCALAVGHEKNLSHILVEAARVLRPGGSILYSDMHPLGTLMGWQRSFTSSSGDTFEVEHHLHLYSDHLQACQAAGLTLDTILEPRIGDQAGPKSQNIPAVLVVKAVKNSG